MANQDEAHRYSDGIDAALLLAGAGLSAWLINQVLATGKLNWRLDRDLVATIALLLMPLGPAVLFTPRLAWRKPLRTWTLGEWLWPGAIFTGLAWLQVWLDSGVYLGPLAKLICGPIALLLTPVLGLVALASLIYSLARPAVYAWTHWLGLLGALLSLAGCLWFIKILLPLSF